MNKSCARKVYWLKMHCNTHGNMMKVLVTFSYYHALITAILFWLVFWLKRLCNQWRLTRCCTSKIFNHATTSRPYFSNCCGSHSMPEFTSRSVSLCTIYTPTLHHTICPPWSHPAPPSCPGSVCDLPPKATSSALDPALSMEIGLSLLNQWSAGPEQPSRIPPPLYDKTCFLHCVR